MVAVAVASAHEPISTGILELERVGLI